MDRKMVTFIKEQYPPGTRIRLNSMDDPYRIAKIINIGRRLLCFGQFNFSFKENQVILPMTHSVYEPEICSHIIEKQTP